MSQAEIVFRERMDMDYTDQECPKCNHAYQTVGERLVSLPYCGACGKTVLDLNHKYCGWCGVQIEMGVGKQ